MLVLADGDILTAKRLENISFVAGDDLQEIQCQAHKGTSGWMLTQQSRTVSCSVNDEALEYGKTAAIHDGDRVELGMLSLIITTDNVIDDEPIQALTTLADETTGLSLRDDATDPFAQVPGLESDRRDATLAFYEQVPKKQDLIDELAQEYMMAVTDASSIHGHQTGPDALRGVAPAFPTVLELEKEIPAHFSLEDVLSGQLSIEQVLAGIGAEDSQWNKTEALEDVLLLFADGIPCRGQLPIPDLTRREHHAISPDSHVAMGHMMDDSTFPFADKLMLSDVTK